MEASKKLQVEEDNEMARDLVIKIFMEANKPKSRRVNATGSSITAVGSRLMLLGKVDTAAEVIEEFTLMFKFKVEALQVKYPIINWEIHTEGSRTYWKIIRNLVKEKFSSVVPSVDKEKALWVELKRLFKPDAKDVPWKLQRKRISLVKWCRDLDAKWKLQVEEDNEMARDLVIKIFMEANKPKSRRVNAAGSSITAAGLRLMLLCKVDTAAEVIEEFTLRVETTIAPATTDEKAQRRLELKARSTLSIGIPNEHQLKFNSIKDAKSLLQALRREVKGMSSSNLSTQNMAFVSSSNNNSTNGVVNTASGISTAGTQFSNANIDKLGDDVIYAFLASQPSSPQLVNKDLKQIHPDDLEEMDLKWQMAMLTIRARRFLKKTDRKLTINGNETIRFDKSNVECYNCHKKEHFARECRAPRTTSRRKAQEGICLLKPLLQHHWCPMMV
nr:hypothetical protein [Tanacetum cinerariifolium]